MPTSTSAIILTDVDFAWPDGTVALEGITATFSTGRTGLVGDNGTGKSTLLRLITGELTPTAGSVRASAPMAHLAQNPHHATDMDVGGLLGVTERLAALDRADNGVADTDDFATIGDSWDLRDQLRMQLATSGLPDLDLCRPAATLSGGEAMLVALVGLRLRAGTITMLDEPTNNLDRDARARVHELVATWPGTLVVVSHDPSLLELMDHMHRNRLSVTGGGFSAWRAHVAAEQEAAERAVRDAERELAVEKRQRVESQTKLARRERTGAKAYAEKRKPKMVMNSRRREAQVSAGKLRGEMLGKEAEARERREAARDQVRPDARIRVDLPDPGVHSTLRLADLHHTGGVEVIQGPERIAIVGPNGVGKTTLLDTLVGGERRLPAYAVACTPRIAYLRQRLDALDDAASAVDNLRGSAPLRTPQEVRAELARFLLRGQTLELPVGELSGGERFRVSLAALLLADPPPQLLVLDEPTNNLDLTSVDQVVDALTAYAGALLIVSHDEAFLDRLGLDRRLALDAGGSLVAE